MGNEYRMRVKPSSECFMSSTITIFIHTVKQSRSTIARGPQVTWCTLLCSVNHIHYIISHIPHLENRNSPEVPNSYRIHCYTVPGQTFCRPSLKQNTSSLYLLTMSWSRRKLPVTTRAQMALFSNKL